MVADGDESVAEARSDTDESLTAERADGDASSVRAAIIAQRVLDDLLERDRLLADERLFQHRMRADNLLALERLASPTRDRLVARERLASDDEKRADRELSDRVLDRERDRADRRSDADRHSADTTGAEQLARRCETDRKLGVERTRADGAEVPFRESSTALADITDERGSRRDLLAIVSHELRGPLTVIALSAGLLLDETEDHASREVAEDIVRSAARMERLLTDLLDIARIEAGTLGIVKRAHDVGALLREIGRLYRPVFAARGLTFAVDEPAALPVACFDHDRLVQVLSNLLGNALKFAPPSGSTRLSARLQADSMEFEVHNDGPAIAASALPHLFERFWQLDSRSRRGLGLGLYISQQIVEQHGGRIWARSSQSEGTSFHFTIPQGAAHRQNLEGPPAG